MCICVCIRASFSVCVVYVDEYVCICMRVYFVCVVYMCMCIKGREEPVEGGTSGRLVQRLPVVRPQVVDVEARVGVCLATKLHRLHGVDQRVLGSRNLHEIGTT